MSNAWEAFTMWPVRVLLLGGAILLLGRLLMLVVRQPAQRVTLGVCTAILALVVWPLSLMPGWMPIYVGEPVVTPEPVVPSASGSVDINRLLVEGEPAVLLLPAEREAPLLAEAVTIPPTADAIPMANNRPDFGPWFFALYTVFVGVLLGRLVLGHVSLRRWWRHAETAPPHVERLFRELAAQTSPTAQVRFSNRMAGPVCFGVVRPCVLLPNALRTLTDPTAWRCIFAHELDHLHRRDPLTAWLMGIVRSVYFVWPWTVGFRRHVRLAQEYLADAQAVRWARCPADYAELLLQMIRPQPLPTGAVGARGTTSDLYRRVTMLLRTSGTMEPRCSRRWTLALGSGLTALAMSASGLYWQPSPAVAQEPTPPKTATAKQEQIEAVKKALDKLKKDLGENNESVKLLERTLKQLQDSPATGPAAPVRAPIALPAPVAPQPAIPFPLPPGNDIDELQKEIQQMQDTIRRQMEEVMRAAGRRGAVGGVIIGPGGQMQPFPIAGQGRLGIRIERPTDALMAQLDLPNGQGLVCVDVPAESPAGKAGLKPHDILLEVGGKAVPSDGNEFVNNLRQIKADDAIDIVILRKGRKETLKGVKLPEARIVEQPRFQPLPLPIPAPPAIDLPAIREGDVRVEAGPGESFRVERFNDAFTVFMSKNGTKVTMTGSVDGGTAKAETIDVEVGGKSTKYESIDQLPKEYQEMAQRALKALKK